MMSGGQKGALQNLKQKLLGESSFTTFVNDVPPEIELSDYPRPPSPCFEGLLIGESLKIKPNIK